MADIKVNESLIGELKDILEKFFPDENLSKKVLFLKMIKIIKQKIDKVDPNVDIIISNVHTNQD